MARSDSRDNLTTGVFWDARRPEKRGHWQRVLRNSVADSRCVCLRYRSDCSEGNQRVLHRLKIQCDQGCISSVWWYCLTNVGAIKTGTAVEYQLHSSEMLLSQQSVRQTTAATGQNQHYVYNVVSLSLSLFRGPVRLIPVCV